MKTKLLIIPLLLVCINLLYLMVNKFYLVLPFDNELLIFNTVCAIILLFFHVKNAKNNQSNKNILPVSISSDSFQINPQILINNFPNFLCIKDNYGRWLGASNVFLSIFNLQDVDYFGKTDAELFHYSNSNNADILKVGSIQDTSVWHLKKPVKETRVVLVDKQKKTLEINRIPIFNDQQEALKIIITGSFISLNDKKKNQLELLPETFENCHLNFMFLNKDFNITSANVSLTLLTGYSNSELIGKPLAFILKGKMTHLQTDFFAGKPRRVWEGELQCLSKTGHNTPVKLEICAITKEDDSVVYFASLLDISQQKQAEKRIIKLSHYDELTGLLNRGMFYNQLRKFISSSGTDNAHAAILVIDLDRFKVINESLGHDAGNELLKVVATRLKELIGSNDIAARLSGDEFAVLMISHQTYEQIVYSTSIVAGKICQKLSEMIYVHNHEAVIGSSVGISIYPEDSRATEPALKAEALLKYADIARNNAKNQGKNSYQFYNKDFNSVSQDKLRMELNLRKAITKNELKLYYQPQYDVRSKTICGAEVLIRWLHNGDKMIPPDQFIGLAEDTGLIIEIGQWILRTACFQLKEWLNEGYALPRISVNVSAQQFSDANFLNLIKKALAESRLAPKYLELELTESMLIGDARFIDLQLNQVKKMGISLALDDFGTGYSSLSYLKNFPIDVLKIDQSFVKEMTVDSKNARIACAIIEIGHSLKQDVIAEGVETREQLDFLRKRGCDIIQGYYISRPLSVEDMTRFLKTANSFALPIIDNTPFLTKQNS